MNPAPPTIRFEGGIISLEPGESVLDALLRLGVRVSYSCRAGVCQSCLLRAASGPPPPASQKGLRDSLKRQGYFLACVCRPVSELEISTEAPADDIPGRIAAIERLAPDVVRVVVETSSRLDYLAGQYATLIREDGLARSYSIINTPGESRLEFHVKRAPGGRMSQWLHSLEAIGAEVIVRGPAGDCYYRAGEPDSPLLLAGTGTGIGPLYGIANEAIRAGHKAPIHLFHAASDAEGLYMHAQLCALAAALDNFHYYPVNRADSGRPDILSGNLESLLTSQLPDVGAFEVYLCGNPTFVRTARKNVFLAGASSRRIHADAFVTSPCP
ncbi:MAG: 2Fe-2S iron-sulfur cluster-binding protein [Bryobacteraceae bacterium]